MKPKPAKWQKSPMLHIDDTLCPDHGHAAVTGCGGGGRGRALADGGLSTALVKDDQPAGGWPQAAEIII